ncbi:hypothetical protein FRB94_009159 [Tulasnella sp. JGI-2019a]|nr:hypothetical protein FRB94_009159 [Tulasnella sp. JGI-2019a]KAG9003172.1 hypothetical protein FRB93_011252 [Tulasnella sp. JGI-2019a]KAG9029379.1 hypothetical protein FRB95_005386 [Tulasnella sp. JGI-2019a]
MDDQLHTSGVPEADSFGDIRQLWFRYNKLADEFDQAMLDRLNRNLDVLLIFAGLFSGVNTAFIVLTLGGLSASTSNRTDALLTLLVLHVQNATLTTNDLNPPRSGSPKWQALRQTEKWVGAEVWGLRAVVKFLPTMLLISLGLFFAALCDYLWTANAQVAVIVITFAMTGVLLYSSTVIVTGHNSRCFHPKHHINIT